MSTIWDRYKYLYLTGKAPLVCSVVYTCHKRSQVTCRDLVPKERKMGLCKYTFSDKLMSTLGNSVLLRSTLFYDIATSGSPRLGES